MDDAAPYDIVVEDSEVNSGSDSSSECEAPKKPAAKAPKKVFFVPSELADSADDVLKAELASMVTSKKCDLHNVQLNAVPPQLHALAGHLTHLTLATNNLSRLPPELFEVQKNLVSFDCQSNKLKSLPRSLWLLPLLQALLLDYNCVQFLEVDHIDPQALLPSIVSIGVEWNDLHQFPDAIVRHCRTLQTFYITENEHIFATAVPHPDVFESRWASDSAPLLIKLDNRPRVVEALAFVKQHQGIHLQWNEIYPNRVLNHLYLGSVRTAQCLSVYEDLNIRYVLTAAKEVDARISEGMRHLVLHIDDVPEEDIRPVFEKSFRFIEEARARDCGVLVHCFAGRSRSVTVTVAYLMKYMNLTCDVALDFVRSHRPTANPNPGFIEALRRYEAELRCEAESLSPGPESVLRFTGSLLLASAAPQLKPPIINTVEKTAGDPRYEYQEWRRPEVNIATKATAV